jgi:hypothetical protein
MHTGNFGPVHMLQAIILHLENRVVAGTIRGPFLVSKKNKKSISRLPIVDLFSSSAWQLLLFSGFFSFLLLFIHVFS